jgi:hypothetical protein
MTVSICVLVPVGLVPSGMTWCGAVCAMFSQARFSLVVMGTAYSLQTVFAAVASAFRRGARRQPTQRKEALGVDDIQGEDVSEAHGTKGEKPPKLWPVTVSRLVQCVPCYLPFTLSFTSILWFACIGVNPPTSQYNFAREPMCARDSSNERERGVPMHAEECSDARGRVLQCTRKSAPMHVYDYTVDMGECGRELERLLRAPVDHSVPLRASC